MSKKKKKKSVLDAVNDLIVLPYHFGTFASAKAIYAHKDRKRPFLLLFFKTKSK